MATAEDTHHERWIGSRLEERDDDVAVVDDLLRSLVDHAVVGNSTVEGRLTSAVRLVDAKPTCTAQNLE